MIALDPGPELTGYARLQSGKFVEAGVLDNEEVLDHIRFEWFRGTRYAIEMVASYGMPVGREVFETCVWIGRFQQQATSQASDVRLVYRRDVKLHLCGSPRAKDSNVRQALLDRFPRTGGGKTPQVGTKAKPGPLYGMRSHAWAALGVALTALETEP
jgi:hypothetical protein